MKNFLLTVSLLFFFSIKPMDPPAISSNENQKIYIKTSDGKAEELELWKIDEMKELSTLLGAQGSNSLVNPLTISLTLQQLNLVSNALDALAQGNFDNFYASLVKKDAKLLKPGQTPLSIDGNLRRLINAADKVGAAAISALCLAQVIPSDIQKKGLIPLIVSNIKTAPLQSLSNPTDIISIAFSPNGKQIVFGCRGPKNNLIIWNNETGQQLHLAGHDRDVLTVAFSPDGKKIVSGSADDENNLIIWDSQTGQQLHNLVGHSDYVLTVAFSPDGNQIVSGCDDNEDNLIIWDSQTGQQLHNLIGHPNDVTTAAFSPDGKKLYLDVILITIIS